MESVSFLMPIASPAPFLSEALASIVTQSCADWRLTAVLDGPDTDIEDSVRRFIPADRLTLVILPVRGGISGALNSGLDVTETEWVARIDADDINLPHRIESQLLAAGDWPDAVLIGGAAETISETGAACGVRRVVAGGDVREPLLAKNRIIHSTAFFRRSDVVRLGGYNARCSLREDYELWLRLATQGSVANVGVPLVRYRLSPFQSSHRPAPASALRYVSAARLDAASTIGVSKGRAVALDLAWRATQRPRFQSALASVRRRSP